MDCYLGIDLGTTGVKVVAVDDGGLVVGRTQADYVPRGQQKTTSANGTGQHEQLADTWRSATWAALQKLMGKLETSGVALESIRGLAVDGTSGSFVAIDATGQPLRPALMYDDARAIGDAAELQSVARMEGASTASILPTDACAKMLWMDREEPHIAERTARFVHQADFVTGCLIGGWDVTDFNNALKSGYDAESQRWAEWLSRFPDIRSKLPKVVSPGTTIGVTSKLAAEACGVPAGTLVFAGTTDGVAAFLASGALRMNDLNTTLGSTLVFKTLAKQPIVDPDGQLYNHRLPDGNWLPGAASNAGSSWIESMFPGGDPRLLDVMATDRLPSPYIAYPLVGRGERFPFVKSRAEAFLVPYPRETADRFAACLQGTALVERLGYERLESVCGSLSNHVHTAGGGGCSKLWRKTRADVTGRAMVKAVEAESAYGAAILAASAAMKMPWCELASRWRRLESEIEPDLAAKPFYDDIYGRFLDELSERGWRRPA